MKNQKGISLIMLLICIVVIIVCLGFTFNYVVEKYKEEKLETLKTQMLEVQAKVKILSEEVIMKKEGKSYIGKKVSENLEDEIIKKLVEENIIDAENCENFYMLENEDLTLLGLKNNNLDKVIVDYQNCEVIYANGFEIKEKLYYKLSDFKIVNEQSNPESEIEEQAEEKTENESN